jgi:hypothetical protein
MNLRRETEKLKLKLKRKDLIFRSERRKRKKGKEGREWLVGSNF